MPAVGQQIATGPRRARFLEQLKALGPGDECVTWPWSSRTDYAHIHVGKGQPKIGAHVWVYEQINGPLPISQAKDGRKVGVLHRCDNPPCVRPSHLFSGEARENLADAARKGRMNRHKRLGLQESQMVAIRSLLAQGVAQVVVAEAFGISQQTVSRIKRGTLWREGKHFTG